MSDDLDRLAAEAAAIDAEASAATDPQPEAEPVPEVDVAGEVAALLQTAAGILTPAFPCLAEIYTEATCRRLGEAAAPVMAKHGWSVGGLFEKWGPEITLAAVALPVTLATWHGIKADLAARRKPEADKMSGAAGAAGAAGQSNYAAERSEAVPAPGLVITAP